MTDPGPESQGGFSFVRRTPESGPLESGLPKKSGSCLRVDRGFGGFSPVCGDHRRGCAGTEEEVHCDMLRLVSQLLNKYVKIYIDKVPFK